ncbi:pilus assembly protein [Shewanella gelidii]|uniref:Type IV pili system adhesin PilY n=1 Tax=Shewanella gelidii TaxID=1642821 RepID=A0A917N7X5_9GAMM|nr:PilC/PilY family type IV pilus protein [Shewanella gelidii]MCL1096616.1 rRNA (guanine-N1)-methyltransferase [Shewanella gelidii]GGI68889.1 type IV pili system adhesin PilY [Shewanella gelidii]
MFIKKCVLFLSAVFAAFSSGVYSDDTELYVFESSARTGARPKVLVIFDNSGSMATIEEDAAGAYDPNYVQEDGTLGYPAVGSSNAYQGRMLYFTKGTGIDGTSVPTPDSPSEARRFLDIINGCQSSRASLDKYGRFTGYLREYSTKGKTGTWEEVPDNNGANIEIIDCWEDIEVVNPKNANSISDGFPVDGAKQGKNAIPYNHDDGSGDWAEAIAQAKNTQFGLGEPVTLYTDDYLRWYKLSQDGLLPTVPQSRLEIAKNAVNSIFNSTLSVDFGLAVFNLDYPYEGDRDGGRIVSGIRNMTQSAKESLLSTLDGLPANTNTPLCETLFEAHQYFSGGTITYGHGDSDYNFGGGNKYNANNPPYDSSIESNGKYTSPLRVCPDGAYVVYITDGVPTVDSHANSAIVALTAGADSEGDYTSFSEGLSSASYLPALASYMYRNDIVSGVDSEGTDHFQNVRTFTIGFSEGAEDAAPLLKETAKRGDGLYFPAKDAAALEEALNDTLTSILAIDSSFTSPSIASNNFDRTQTFDAAYYAMFLPSKGPRWSGNLKKLKVTSSGKLVDADNKAAISATGNISDKTCTIWSDCSAKPDGNKVVEGGVNAMLANASKRKILVNSGGSGALEELNVSNIANGDLTFLASFMGIPEDEIASTVKWLYGFDVDNDRNFNPFNASSPQMRTDIMGDPLHSKPLALNFGSPSAPDVRILLGTNQGLVHMFQDHGDTVSEPWAFLPYELLPNVAKLRNNVSNNGHSVYGMDASPVSYVESGESGITKAWVFMGMRRGGRAYYALDVTSPDNPQLMWRISDENSDFSDLGQSWSKPVVTSIPGHEGPVLIFGGGYDVSYDSAPSPLPAGRAVYIVDAATGQRLHVFNASGSGGTKIPGLADSIPNSVAVLDSNSDGKTDRIYATDVGGNIWRMDMPSESQSDWSAYKLADLGGTLADDRRFFSEPAVAQTVFSNISEITTTVNGETKTIKTYQNVPYDAVTVGSGNRPTPSAKDINDMFFVIQDRNVITKTFGTTDDPIPSTIQLGNLYDVTSTYPDNEAENIAFGQKRGWYYNFTNEGEKSLSAPLIVAGKVYFTSYMPPSSNISETVCTISGQGRLYVFDLHKGTRNYTHYFYDLGERVPDTPQIVIPAPESGEDPYVYIIGVGKGEKGDDGDFTGTINVGSGLGVNKIYYHIQE